MKNSPFRVWGWKTKISCHTAVVRDRVTDDDVFDDALPACRAPAKRSGSGCLQCETGQRSIVGVWR